MIVKGSESQDDVLRRLSRSNILWYVVEGRTKQLILFGVRGAIAARGGNFRVTILGGPGDWSSTKHPSSARRRHSSEGSHESGSNLASF